MKLKRKLLYATLLASSCLISTTIVAKADTTTQAPNSQSIVAPVPEQNNDSQAPDVSKDSSNSESQTTNNVQSNGQEGQANQSVQANQQAETQTAQPTYHDTPVDGVYTVGNNFTILYDINGVRITDRGLAPNSNWYTDTFHDAGNGASYYRVATNEYADKNAGTYRSYVQPFSGNATVVYKKGASAHDFEGYGKKAVYHGNNLPTGSTWKVTNHANIGGKEWYQIGNNTWIPQDYVVINGGQYKEASWISGVPLIAQRPELPNGCEITAVTMMLQYAGAKVDKMQMAREMPRSSNPEYGYIGQPWDSTGITIFPNALMSLVEKYAGTAKDLTGQGFDAIKYQIDLGHPVVTWHTLYGFPYHALVVTGYDKNYVYYNDCWTDKTLQMGINQFINNWNTQNRRAISY